MDTAAIIKSLDYVVTSDTALAHLAGALGVKTCVVLGFTPDWRWLLSRSDCPWYPSLKLFRQNKIGDWGPVVNEVCQFLANGANCDSASSTLTANSNGYTSGTTSHNPFGTVPWIRPSLRLNDDCSPRGPWWNIKIA
jgi:hypothetical protein